MKTSSFRKKKRIFWGVLTLSVVFVSSLLFTPGLARAADSQSNFYVDSTYDSAGRANVSASLKQEGARAYFYVEDAWWNGLPEDRQNSVLGDLANLSQEFDSKIYPAMTSIYGSEWNPGIDGDPKITFLITKMSDEAGGYFNYVDEFSRSQFSNSNEREMVYLNSTYLGTSRSLAFLSHEFQHLITFYQKNVLNHIDEDTWLNEARSEYAATLLGYDSPYLDSNLEKRVGTFSSQPSNPLAEWKNETADYGVANLFMQYLVDHYGTRILTLMTQNSFIGVDSVNSALQAMGVNKTFSDVFADWALANFTNNCNLGSSSYCYANSNLSYSVLHVSPTASYSMGQGYLELATWIKDWSPRWYQIDASGGQDKILQISFEGFGNTSQFEIPYITKENGAMKVHFLSISSDQKGSLLIPNFGSQVQAVILIPINTFKKSGFSASDPNTPFSFKLSTQSGQPAIFPDGSLVKAADDSRVYLIGSGMKRWISNADIFIARNFKWENINVISAADLLLYPDGQTVGWPDGTLVKSNVSPGVYVISSGMKRAFASAEIFSGLGYQWGNIKIISQQDIDQYATGSVVASLVYPEGTLVRFDDGPNIYLIFGGQKRLIPALETFISKGYDFKLVVVASAKDKNIYPYGQIIT